MVLETPIITALIAGLFGVMGVIITFIATRGRTKTDARVALDERIDERMKSELESTWSRLDAQDAKLETLRKQNKAQAAQIEELKAHALVSERREAMIYQHTRALRDHIINELPPPPPTMPLELQRWFEKFEVGGTTPINPVKE